MTEPEMLEDAIRQIEEWIKDRPVIAKPTKFVFRPADFPNMRSDQIAKVHQQLMDSKDLASKPPSK